jgi:hypothetical protein
MFGGEGLFVTTLTGPGTVWLQGQPPQRMIGESPVASLVVEGLEFPSPLVEGDLVVEANYWRWGGTHSIVGLCLTCCFLT